MPMNMFWALSARIELVKLGLNGGSVAILRFWMRNTIKNVMIVSEC